MLGHAQAQSMYVRPYVDAAMTYSDNVGADRSGGQGDFHVEVAPGIAVNRDSGRLKGNFNGRLRNIFYMTESDRNDSFLSLNGHGQFEAVERLLFIDMNASITRNNRSTLLGRLPGDRLDTESANETRMFGVGPRLEFRLGAETNGNLAYMHRWVTGSGGLKDRQEGVLTAQLSDPTYFGRLGWGLDYYRVDSDSGRGGMTGASTRESVRGTLYAKVSSQLRLRGIVGRERNDYELGPEDRGTIVGGGFDWNPTPRTTISGTTEKRMFGRGHDFRFSHRRPRSVWSLSYVRDISSSLESLDFDVFTDPEFRLLYDALERLIPDPLLREALVRRQLGYPEIGARGSEFTNAYYTTRNLAASVSLMGVRNVLTFMLRQSERERLGAAAISDPRDDLSRFNNVKTRSASVSLSHRLSPVSTATAVVTRTHSKGEGAERADTRRTSLNLGISKELGPNTRASLTFLHQRADGASSFTENALTATLSISF